MAMMTENPEKDKIDELLELTRENNRILRSMHRRMIWSQIFTFVYWLIILGVAGASFYFFQPYINKYMNTYQTIMHSIDQLDKQSKSLPSNIQGVLDKVR